uniref:Neuronal regeneration-related protein n=1 Tax=Moschus moschiferus TaxID=68415 RepID=A0A8C6D481_MOSMO
IIHYPRKPDSVSFCVFFCLCALQGRLPIPKKVNLKKDGKTKTTSVTPLGSDQFHSLKISHLHFLKPPPFVLHMVQWYW